MKHISITLSTLLLLTTMACKGNKAVDALADLVAGDSAETVAVSDTLVFENIELKDSMTYKVKVVDYSSDEDPVPYQVEKVTDMHELSTLKCVAGKPEVVEYINQWLTIDAAGEYVEAPATAKMVAEKYAGLKKQGITDVRSAFKQNKGSMDEEASEDEEDEESLQELAFASANESSASISVIWQTPTLITLWDEGYDYSAGAAHGMPWGFGRTFDLTKLRILTIDDIIKEDGKKAVLKILVDMLQEEYGDSEMMNEPEDIDFPSGGTSLFAEGVAFDYGAYEIGAYALGMPQEIIPYEQIKPYLTDEVKALLGLE